VRSAAVFDLHDEAYHRWRDAGVRRATLVHVDGHHDLERPSSPVVHVGNYVRVAIDEGIVSRLAWVLPRPMWDDPSTRAVAERDLAVLASDIDAVVTPLSAARGQREPVLLDVDLDYLFTAAFDHDRARSVLPDPWCSADALAADLDARWPSRTMTTVATSLTGAFTPLRWKHLADALAARLDGVALSEGWDAAARDFAEAERLYACGSLAEARACFARAVAVDPEYRHPFRTTGYIARAAGRTAEAARAFRDALDLDPQDGWARLGLAMLAVDAGQPGEALTSLGPLAPSDARVDAWRTASRAYDALGDYGAAIAAANRALSLALGGAVPLSVWTSNRDRRLVDPDHLGDHERLASLHRRVGDRAAATAHQRIVEAAGLPVRERA
jgi:tetratricopeptide (TPR) repeat protein